MNVGLDARAQFVVGSRRTRSRISRAEKDERAGSSRESFASAIQHSSAIFKAFSAMAPAIFAPPEQKNSKESNDCQDHCLYENRGHVTLLPILKIVKALPVPPISSSHGRPCPTRFKPTGDGFATAALISKQGPNLLETIWLVIEVNFSPKRQR
jgi:hypothetical protein